MMILPTHLRAPTCSAACWKRAWPSVRVVSLPCTLS